MATAFVLSTFSHCQQFVNGAMEKEIQRSKSDIHHKRKIADGSGAVARPGVGTENEPLAKKRRTQPTSQPPPDHSTRNDPTVEPETNVTPKTYNQNYLLKKAQQKAAMQRPKVFLTIGSMGVDTKLSPDNGTTTTERSCPPLYIVDLQTLLVFTLVKGIRCSIPRWCCIKRTNKTSSVVLVALKDVSVHEFQQYADCFPFLAKTFSQKLRVQMVSPSKYFSSFDIDMYAVPLMGTDFRQMIGHLYEGKDIEGRLPKHVTATGTDTAAGTDTATGTNTATGTDTGADRCKSSEPGEDDVCSVATERQMGGCGSAKRTLSKTDLLLSVQQMTEESYPLPFDKDDESCPDYTDFVFSKKSYAPVTADSPLFAVDCEMCLTTSLENELARVSIVNEENEVVYDELVKPHNVIIDHLTRYSGITQQMLAPVTKHLEDVQKEISELLPPDAILCGQSLGNDLRALKMFHQYVIDTSIIYNLSGSRRIKCGLKRLAWEFLGRVIQNSEKGHSSAEDALATMELVKLKLSKSLEFGDAVLGEIDVRYVQPYHQGPAQITKPGASASTPPPNPVFMRSLFVHLYNRAVSACLIGGEKLVSKFREEPELKCMVTDSDKQASKEAARASRERQFTWVQLSAFTDLLASEDQQGNMHPEGRGQPPHKHPSEEQKRKVLKKLDNRVKGLVTKLQEKCLVAVVMTGRHSGEQHFNAVTFLHIT